MRVKIAEYFGAKTIVLDSGMRLLTMRADDERDSYTVDFGKPDKDSIAFSASVPNYPGDLNACHEAEKILPEWVDGSYAGTRYHYVHMLGTIANPVWATAQQRCEAFLRTLGLFEEGGEA